MRLFPTIWFMLRQIFQGDPGGAVDAAHEYAEASGHRNRIWLVIMGLTYLFSGLSFAVLFRQASYYLAEAALHPGTGILQDAMAAVGFFTDGFSFGDLLMAMLFILSFFLLLLLMRPLALRAVLRRARVQLSGSEAATLLAISLLPVLLVMIIAPPLLWLEGWLGFLPLVLTTIALVALAVSLGETLLWSAVLHIIGSHSAEDEPSARSRSIPVILHAVLSASTLMIVLTLGTFIAWPVLRQLYL